MLLRKQGASKGAVSSFLISTPESGFDSIAITWALMDPLFTIIRPVAAFFTAITAGVMEVFTGRDDKVVPVSIDRSCPVDGCCDGINCPPDIHRRHHTFFEKFLGGMRYAFTEFWDDLAMPLLFGLFLAGVVAAIIPDGFLSTYLGQGLPSMLIMLVAGVPMYICATASTPIAAALIIKGVSPGAVLVFLLAGPATNAATIIMMAKNMGKRSTAVYLISIAVCSVLAGLLVDMLYNKIEFTPIATMGEASEPLPFWLAIAGAVILILLFFKTILKRLLIKRRKADSSPERLVSIQASMKSEMNQSNSK